jgi:hypothetical protein
MDLLGTLVPSPSPKLDNSNFHGLIGTMKSIVPIFEYLIEGKILNRGEASPMLLNRPYVYLIEDPEPNRIAPIFGYTTLLELSQNEIRYVGYSAAKMQLRERYRDNQPLLYSWFVHLRNLGYGTHQKPIRKKIILTKNGVSLDVKTALDTERYYGRLGLGKHGGRLLNQVEPGGDTYGSGPSLEGRKKISIARQKCVDTDQAQKNKSDAGLERAKRELENGKAQERARKIRASKTALLFDGKLCLTCNTTQRYQSNNHCVICHLGYERRPDRKAKRLKHQKETRTQKKQERKRLLA